MLTKINKSVGGLRGRLAKEESGFTLIELLVVLVIIGVLLAIAVPSYLGFKKRAEQSAALSNMRAAIPSIEAYYSDEGTYTGMTPAGLKASYDAGLKDSELAFTITNSGAGYTIADTVGCTVAAVAGPGPNLEKSAVTFGGTCQ
jgi:type IV pilus assembly protein PilA